MTYLFRKTIWAVGQGGFSMGTLYKAGKPKRRLYTYVYDCGSDQLTELRREVKSAHLHFDADEPKAIETVFISHLDADHVNGFDSLCESFDRRIEHVVLPYLDLESRYYLAAKAMADNSASGLFMDFVVDPLKWVRSRLPGAQIDLLGPQPGDDPDAPPPDFDIPHQRSQAQGIRDDTGARPQVITRRSLGFKTIYKNELQYRWISVAISPAGMASPLLLLASVPPRSSAKLDAFREKLKSCGFGKMSVPALRAVLADPLRREELRTCFLELASDHNIISMHLLVKSTGDTHLHTDSNNNFYRRGWFPHRPDRVGFLFSGDAKLSTKKYFNHWKRFYEDHLGDVAIFSLPHHGSGLSFETQILNELPNANFIAQAGNNGHGHPSSAIVQQIQGANRHFHQVNGSAHSRIDTVFEIH